MNKAIRDKQSELFLLADDLAEKYLNKLKDELGFDDAYTSYYFIKTNLAEYCLLPDSNKEYLEIILMKLDHHINEVRYQVNPRNNSGAFLHNLKMVPDSLVEKLGFRPVYFSQSVEQATQKTPDQWFVQADSEYREFLDNGKTLEQIMEVAGGNRGASNILQTIFFRALGSYIGKRLYISKKDMEGLFQAYLEWISYHKETGFNKPNAIEYNNGELNLVLSFPLSFKVHNILN